MRYTIGLDIDGVTARYVEGLRAKIATVLNIAPADVDRLLPAPLDYAFSNWSGAIGDQFKKFHTDAVDNGLYAELASFEDASKYLWMLSDEDFYIRVITSRFVKHGQNGRVVADTALWLDRENIPYRGLVFESNKIDVFADIYVDDAPHNIEAFQKKGSDVIIFDAPYNQHCVGHRAYNWADVYRLIHEISARKDTESLAA